MNKELLWKVPSKNMEVILLWKKNKNIFWFLNNSEHHHQEMGLELVFYVLIKHIHIFDLIFKFKRKQNKTYIYSQRYEDVFTTLQYNYRALKIVGPLRWNFLAVRNLKVCKLGKTVSSEWLMANCENMQWHNLSLDDGKSQTDKRQTQFFKSSHADGKAILKMKLKAYYFYFYLPNHRDKACHCSLCPLRQGGLLMHAYRLNTTILCINPRK